MLISIGSSGYTAKINTLGAELTSLKSPDEMELIWNGNADYWDAHSPTLFPTPGKLRDLKYCYQGKFYDMPPHGFAKIMEFQVKEASPDAAELMLASDEETKKFYPFDFEFYCRFTITETGLCVTREVKNTGVDRMYFSCGEHTGLSTQALGCGFEECELKFERKENLVNWALTAGLLDHEEPYLRDEDTIPLSKGLFQEKGCLVLQGMKSKHVTLRRKGGSHGIRIQIKGFPALVLWTPYNEGQFICVEPWQALPSAADGGYELEERPCILSLEGGGAYSYSYTIGKVSII